MPLLREAKSRQCTLKRHILFHREPGIGCPSAAEGNRTLEVPTRKRSQVVDATTPVACSVGALPPLEFLGHARPARDVVEPILGVDVLVEAQENAAIGQPPPVRRTTIEQKQPGSIGPPLDCGVQGRGVRLRGGLTGQGDGGNQGERQWNHWLVR